MEPDTTFTRRVCALLLADVTGFSKPMGENEYFSDGITEDLITALFKVSGLRVAVRPSSVAFKGRNEPIESIGAQLHVGAVLERQRGQGRQPGAHHGTVVLGSEA